MNAVIFISKTLIDLYILAYVLRLVLQWVRADFYNPFSQFVMRITNPLVLPGRKLLPAMGRVDTATLLAIVLLEILAVVFLVWLISGTLPARPAEVLLYAALRTLVAFINLFFFAIIIRVIQSWVSPGAHSPITAVIWAITEPLLGPVRRLIPDIGGLDISPLFVIIGLQALRMLIPLPPALL